MEIDPGIERIVRIEIQISVGNLQPAEGQRRFHFLEPDRALQTRVQTRPDQFQIDDCAAIREVSADQKSILCLDRDVELPIAQWRSRKGKLRLRRWWLRRRPTRQPDRNQIDVLEKLAIR